MPTHKKIRLSSSVASKFDYAHCGVSLAHLARLPISPDASFEAARDWVKARTARFDEKSNRSYARYLRSNPKLKHLVREKATVFVSYAWKGGFGPTIRALTEHFAGRLDETFVWMDFASYDQYKATTTAIDFHVLAKTFKQTLLKIGRAVLVLTPGEKPVAISRSWCCFEWMIIAQSSIPFTYCVPKEDEDRLVQRIHEGDLLLDHYESILSGINVETAEAEKESDRVSILELMKEIGVVKVNDIVMSSLKGWLSQVSKKAEEIAADGSNEMSRSLTARAGIQTILVSDIRLP